MGDMNNKMEFLLNEIKELRPENLKKKEEIKKQNENLAALEREIGKNNIIIRIEDNIVEWHKEMNDKMPKRMEKPKNDTNRSILLKLITGDSNKDTYLKEAIMKEDKDVIKYNKLIINGNIYGVDDTKTTSSQRAMTP